MKSSPSSQASNLHALLFIVTLQMVCLACGIIANTLRSTAGSNTFITESNFENDEKQVVISWIGALLAWSISIFLFIKK